MSPTPNSTPELPMTPITGHFGRRDEKSEGPLRPPTNPIVLLKLALE